MNDGLLLTLKKQFLYVIPNGISGMAVGELRKISAVFRLDFWITSS